MTTQFLGIKDFRQNLATFTKKSKNENIRYIILKKNVPVFEVRPIDEKDFVLEKLVQDVKHAEEQIKKGNYYTQEEVMKEFGLI
ncbi:MAG: hypothetical protein AAB373_05855 [Patescibacteria group bacterium]